MSHLTDLQLSMHADGALAENEVAGLQSHIDSCSACHGRLIDYTEERRLIGTALQSDDNVAVPDIEMPRFKPPITLRSFAIANLVTGLAVWLGQFLWKTLFGELIMSAFTQITSLYVPDAYELMANTVLYLSEEGIVMLDNYIGYIALLIAVVTMVWLAASWRRAATGLVVLVATGLLLPVNDAQALEIRRSENMVSVEAAEVIEDTVIMVGDTIVIEGDVRGDLVATGRRIVMSGSVGGNLVALAESVSIQGDVGGFVISAASSVELGESTVGGDLWSASANTTLGRDTRITGNATVATELVS
ncbi:MAG: hypothetical protein HOE54_04790, partial [Gammaproteobacteria bacterium]|nr:hypothetical protein [Gammaproteobacteria bacterium]